MGNLNTSITADVTDLQTKFAIARAEVSGLSSEMNKLARASAAGLIDSAGTQRLQQLAGDFVAAKTSANSLGVALGQASGGVLGFGNAAEHGHESVATMGREVRKLFTELKEGSAGGADVTLIRIAQSALGLGPAALVGIAGVTGLGAALAYLVEKSTTASEALDKAFLGAQWAGNLSLTREQLKQFTDEMATASNISGSDAQKIAATLASIPGITVPVLHNLTAEISDLSAVTGTAGPKMAEDLAKAFSSKTTAEEYVRTLGGVTQSQIDMAKAADESGNAIKVQQAKFEALLPVIGRSTTTIDQEKTALSNNKLEFLEYAGAMAEGTSLEEIQADVIAHSNQQRQKQLEILRQSAAAMSSQQQSPDQALQGGLKIAQGENPMVAQIAEAQAKVQALQSDLSQVQGTASKANLDLLNAGLESAKEKLAELQFGPALDKMRADMAQVASSWDGTQSGMLAKQIQIAQAELANTSQSAKQRLEVETEISHLETQLRQATANESVAAARESVSAIAADTKESALQRLEAERQVWQETLAGLRQGTSQYVEAERALSADVVAIARETAAQQATIARQDAAADIAISRMKVEAEKSALDMGTAANAQAVAQRLAQLRALTATEFSLDEQQLENELKNLQEGTAEYDRVYNEIRGLKAKLVADLAALDNKAAADTKKAAKEDAAGWKSAVGEIENAESGLVSNLLNKRKSLSQSLLQVGANLVTQEISQDLKAMTSRLLIQDQGEAQTKSMQQGGLLFHGFIELQKLLQTQTSQAGQTSANVAGNTARLTSQQSADAASKAQAAASGGSTVLADAAKAFSGTYASVSQIPYVGWILAPPAAAAAYAAVAAYEGAASLDVGTNYVPRDMYARIHEGEAVIPREYNPAAGGRGFGGDGETHVQHNYGSVHVNAVDTRGFAGMLSARGNQRAIANALRSYVGRGGGRGR